MDDGFRYYYPVKLLKQMSFEEKEFTIPQYGEGHIEHNDVLLCKASKEALVKKMKGENGKTLKNRLNGKMCACCEELYKQHPESAWYKFVNGQNIQSTPLPALIDLKP